MISAGFTGCFNGLFLSDKDEPFTLLSVFTLDFLSIALLLAFNGLGFDNVEAILEWLSDAFLISSLSFKVELDFFAFRVRDAVGIDFFG